LNAYQATPSSGKGPGVLIIHAWWGLNGFFRSVCDRLAAEGFVALAPDLFEGRVASAIAQARKLRARPKKEPTYKTLLRAVDRLQGLPQVQGTSIGVIGFSMGGHWALWLAANRPELRLKAVTTFYGARAGDYSASPAAFQGHFAERDAWVSASALKKLRQSLELAPRGAEMHIYPGTGHWFFESDRDEAYQRQAAELAWERTLVFLRKNLKRR
jgi:carboxymethylenebutenolidase